LLRGLGGLLRKSYGESEGAGRRWRQGVESEERSLVGAEAAPLSLPSSGQGGGAARWTWSVALHGSARRAAVMLATFRRVLYFLMNSISKVMAISSPITPGYLVMPKSERWMVAVAEAPRR
jgi:hypothetical protein